MVANHKSMFLLTLFLSFIIDVIKHHYQWSYFWIFFKFVLKIFTNFLRLVLISNDQVVSYVPQCLIVDHVNDFDKFCLILKVAIVVTYIFWVLVCTSLFFKYKNFVDCHVDHTLFEMVLIDLNVVLIDFHFFRKEVFFFLWCFLLRHNWRSRYLHLVLHDNFTNNSFNFHFLSFVL